MLMVMNVMSIVGPGISEHFNVILSSIDSLKYVRLIALKHASNHYKNN